MAKNPRPAFQTKKHQARLERERIQRLYLTIGAITVFVIVMGLIIYGVLSETLLKQRQPVAIVNGERITTNAFQIRTRYLRQQLIGNAINTYQFLQMFSDSPDTQAQFAGQLSQIEAQLNPISMGQQVLDQLTDEVLIAQEAERRGLSVSDEEVDSALQEAFGYFPDGTPTPKATLEQAPTSTLSAFQMTAVPPTSTPTYTPEPSATPVITATEVVTATATATLEPSPTVEPSITPTRAPTASPTAYTLDAYQSQYQETVSGLKETIDIDEDDFRQIVRTSLLREKVAKAIADELAPEPVEEQVWARHILVIDMAIANVVQERLKAGDDWSTLAAEFSTDESNKFEGGDLGWFGRGQMVAEFEDAAFATPVGEISDPVQTSFGVHLIQVLGHEERPLDQSGYDALREKVFQNWLTEQRDAAEIEILDIWTERVPAEPTMPAEILDFIQTAQQAPVQELGIPTPADQ